MYCQKCGKQIADGTAFCPECGAPQNAAPSPAAPQNAQKDVKHKKKRSPGQIVLGIIILIIALSLIGKALGGGNGTSSGAASSSAPSAGTSPAAEKNDWDGKFEPSELTMTTDSLGLPHITGSITNLTDKEYSYIQVEINLYDDTGAQVGSALANANHLEAKGVWKFEAIGSQAKVATCKIKGITAF